MEERSHRANVLSFLHLNKLKVTQPLHRNAM
jgi:hypothetical protein